MMLSEKELKELCQTATKAAKAAGEYIQSQFDQHYSKSHKAGLHSLAAQVVTAVDIKAQEIILEHLQSSIKDFDLGLLTEEAADDQSRTEKAYFWCIDPMDGTLPFIEGRTGYAVSIALISKAGNPVVGVVYIPDLEACYKCVKGSEVQLNDKPFIRDIDNADKALVVFMDSSLKNEGYFDQLKGEIKEWAEQRQEQVQYRDGFGAVRNAIGVMNSKSACYFKLPKKRIGGGSIWDFAATRLFFEELDLHISDSSGNELHLNNPNTTFMNHVGVLYASDKALADLIVSGQQHRNTI